MSTLSSSQHNKQPLSVRLLAVASLVSATLCILLYLILDGEYYDTLALLYDLFFIAPFILLLIGSFCPTNKAGIFFPIVFGTLVINQFFYTIAYAVLDGYFITYNLVPRLLFVVAFVLALCHALTKSRTNILLILAAAVVLLAEFLYFITGLDDIEWYLGDAFVFVGWLLDYVSYICLAVTVLLFGLSKRSTGITPEQALLQLNIRYANGRISEEQYAAERARIINSI